MLTPEQISTCCGCFACADACEADAISFVPGAGDFPFPRIETSRCKNCGVCSRICPIGSTPARTDPQDVFQAVHKNLPTRFASSCGGVFTALANAVYRQGGCVGGAVWTDDFSVVHLLSANRADLLRLRGRKVVQSDAHGFYRAVVEALKAGKPVLACGTPCQVVALKKFVSVRSGLDASSLVTVSFPCSGVCSASAFAKFLEAFGEPVLAVETDNREMASVVRPEAKIRFKKGVRYARLDALETNRRKACQACPFAGKDVADVQLAISTSGFSTLIGQQTVSAPHLGVTEVRVFSESGARLVACARASLVTPGTDPKPREEEPACTGKVRPRLTVRQWLARQRFIWTWMWQHRSLRTLAVNPLRHVFAGAPLFLAVGPVVIDNRGKIELGADVDIGSSFHREAQHPTRITVSAGGTLRFQGTAYLIAGSDLEILPGGCLTIGPGVVFNICAEVICAGNTTVGRGTAFGRHVTVRDNNGGHWMNVTGYKNVSSVEIGEHVWLCEGVTVMPGVRIGSGSVIGAKSLVTDNIPVGVLATGVPAAVLAEGVAWKL